MNESGKSNDLTITMKKTQAIGIVAYGAYLPGFLIKTEEIATARGKNNMGPCLNVKSKTVADVDEDTATIAVEAALQAINRSESAGAKRKDIEALFVGSESHPYAVKPTGTMVTAALGLGKKMAMADMQFACKAGTQSLQVCLAMVKAGWAKLGLAIGADIAQSRPGGALEYTAGAGGAAFLVGEKKLLARLLGTTSVASDTPDFWRRPEESFPQHAGRFSGNPAYFKHSKMAFDQMLEELKMKPKDFDYCVFHTPNGKFPTSAAKKFGFSKEQNQKSLLVRDIGNLYAGSTMVGLAGVLDIAKNGEKILVISYGSGSGSDCLAWECSTDLESRRKEFKNLVRSQISKNFISYSEYQKR